MPKRNENTGAVLPRARAHGAASALQLALFVVICLTSVLLLPASISPANAQGSSERYDYDALGRLIRVIDGAGRVTEYEYDAAGNIRAVRTGGSAAGLAPTIAGVSIASFRKAESAQVVVTGTNFVGARLNSADPEVDISNVAVTATQYRFTVSSTDASVPGVKNFTIANAAGNAAFSLTLAPPLPRATFNPQPIALPPDNAPRTFNLVLSNADTISHTVNFSVDNTAVATVSPASVTFAVGETTKTIQITGRIGGLTTVRASSVTLGAASAPVFVTADFAGVRTAYAAMVGVVVETPPVQNTLAINGMISPAVGVTVGPFFRSVQPRALLRGQTTQMVVTGANLQGVTGVAINPAAGITVANVTPAADGLSVVADVTVATDAAIAPRQVVLTGAGGPFRASTPDGDRVWVVDGLPVIDSIDPFQAAPGTFGITFRVRGRNLQTAERILIAPTSNVRISNAFTVNADGTEIVGGVEVPLNARVGSYAVQVATFAGTSDGVPTPFNTFNVVNEIQSIFTPIYAPLVGVVNGTAPATPLSGPLFSNSVGVAFGAAISDVQPRTAGIGQTTTVTLIGNALTGLTSVQITPADGLTVGPVTVAADGRSATFDVTVAADAPRTLRRLRALAGSTTVPFSLPELGALLITQPLPALDSVTPINLRAGDPPLAFTVRGRNLQLLSAVRFVPATGIVVGSDISVNADGTLATVSVTVQAGAPTGQRVVVVETPAGLSSDVPTAANTVTIANTVTARFDGLVAPLVGVQNGPAPSPQPVTFDPILAPLVGVVLEAAPVPGSATYNLHTQPIGVAFGPVATALEQTALVAGASGTLTITGIGLDAVTLIEISPATGITVGTPAVNGTGSQLTIPLTVAAGTGTGPRQIRLAAGTARVQFTQAASSLFYVAAAAPRIDSIEPIFGRQGEGLSLLIRGANLLFATAVQVEPEQGVTVTGAPIVNAAGTEATVPLRIAADAALGGRVIRIVTPGGTTSNVPEPANTFTVFAP